jgi:putative salt-induced outer membrane protein YdiY
MLPLLVGLLPLPPAPQPLDLSLEAFTFVQEEPAAAPEEAAPPPEPGWHGTLSAGLTLTRGNSETTTIAVAGDAEHKTEADRWTTSVWFNQDEQEDPDTGDSTTTAKNYGGKLQYDRFLTEKLYWLANAKGERDEAASLQFRGTAGLGLGYQFKDTESFKLNGEAGLNWVHEDLEGESPNEFLAARLASNWEYLWTETTKLGQTAELYPSLEDSDDWTSKIDTHADVSMTKAMFLRLQHVLDYDNTPAEGAKKADNRVLVTVGWTF